MAQYLGFDGFRGGWVTVWIDDRGNHGFDYSSDLSRLVSIPHSRAMIDMGMKKKQRRNKALVDEIAATIILQEYLEKKQGTL